jgi:protein TonB
MPEPQPAAEAAVQTPLPTEPIPAPAFAAPSGFADAPEPRRGKMLWLWGAVAAIVLACSGALFVYPGLLRKQVRPMTPLTLHIERTASDILLTWNRDSDAIKNAKRAVLSIYDGDRQENFDMDLAQLHNGSIVYAPLTQDVSFKMELTGADQNKLASEMVRVLRTRPSPMGDSGAQPAQTAAAPAKPAEAAKASTPAPEQPAEEEQEEAAPARTTPVRAFNAESLSQRLRPALSTEAPAAPSLSATNAPVATMNLGVIVPSQIAAPARPSSGSNAAPAPRSSQVVPAQVISRTDPVYPQLARQTGASGQVRVSVVIGVDGKVKSVKATSGNILLQRAATDAVKQWVYRPTMLNGKAVESQSEVVLTFNAQR